MEYDVAIAGAGIAGSALAIELGRRGYSVAVFERGEFPREKPCGEGLMPGGVAALEEMGIETRRLGTEFRGIRYFFDGRLVEGRFASHGRPAVGRGVRRRELDAALARLAAETSGVTLRTGTRVSGPFIEHGRVKGLVVEDQAVRARLVVAADGAQSRLRHTLGLDRPVRRKRIGMRMHFQSAGAPAQTFVEVFLESGYEMYVTPLPEGEFLVAALAEADGLRGPAKEQFRRWCEAQPVLRERMHGAKPVSELMVTCPLSGRARRRVIPGCVLLGDAAGFTDPITGGGMTQGLQTARLLAAHLAAARDWNEAALTEFDRAREAALHDYRRVTAGVLWLARHPRLLAAGLDLLRATPRVFAHVLGAATGSQHLFSRDPVVKMPPIAPQTVRAS